MEVAWEEMSRMIFAPLSRAWSYPVWKSLDFHLQITCLRTGITVRNSFVPYPWEEEMEKTERTDVTPHKAQELRLPLLPWSNGSLPFYSCFPSPVSSLSSSSSRNLHSLHMHHSPLEVEAIHKLSIWPQMLSLPPHLPPQWNQGIHWGLEREEMVHLSARQAPYIPLQRMFYQLFNSGSGNIIQPMFQGDDVPFYALTLRSARLKEWHRKQWEERQNEPQFKLPEGVLQQGNGWIGKKVWRYLT